MKINIKGLIVPNSEAWVYDWLNIEHTAPKHVEQAIDKADGEKLEVYINSGGGSVDSGSEIYALLKDYKGESVGKILGVAGSAASYAALGVKNLLIAPTARFMIHFASASMRGNADTFKKGAEILSTVDNGIANAYILKTGMERNQVIEMMRKETYLNAQEAKEKGFVDAIMFDEENVLLSNSHASLLPASAIEKIRNELKGLPVQESEEDLDNSMTLLKAKLNLRLKL